MSDDAFERAVQREMEGRDEQRRERVEKGNRLGFRVHLAVFVAVQLLLVAVWALTGADHPWFLYPLLGWGVGLAAHYVVVREVARR